MEATTEPVEVEDDGGPVEEGAEATRTMAHLFQYSMYVHAGDGAEGCENRENGRCSDAEHFHAWVTLPNKLQHTDIQEKARAARARRKRALRDAGGDGRQPSEAYITLESELDDLMLGDREKLLTEIAERNTRKHFGEYVIDIRENDERFEHYAQDAEEYRRLVRLPEGQRDEEAFKALDDQMSTFAQAIETRVEEEAKREVLAMLGMGEDGVREIVRAARIEGEAFEQSQNTYYTWLAFVGTRVPPAGNTSKRYFAGLEDLRGASPEAVDAIDNALKDLEGRMVRGDSKNS